MLPRASSSTMSGPIGGGGIIWNATECHRGAAARLLKGPIYCALLGALNKSKLTGGPKGIMGGQGGGTGP